MAQATNTLSRSPNLTTGPPRSQLKTPAHTLVRVRNNQRRHRERRREYIASLEQKLQETERLLAQATAELATSKLELERWRNEVIKQQPHENQESSHDIVPEDALSTARDITVNADLGMVEKPIGAQEKLSDTVLLDYSTTSLTTPSTLELPLFTNILPSAPSRPSAWMLLQTQDPLDQLDHAPSCYLPSYCELVEDSSVPSISEDNAQPESDPELRKILSPPPSFCNIYPPSNTESTTLCSQAFVLISQQNFREVDTHTIRSWLHEGFRQARNENEGCRVDNKLLFGLLDFISSS